MERGWAEILSDRRCCTSPLPPADREALTRAKTADARSRRTQGERCGGRELPVLSGRRARAGGGAVVDRHPTCDELLGAGRARHGSVRPASLVAHAHRIRAVLEVIATGLATDRDQVDDFVKRTLLYHSSAILSLQDVLGASMDSLLRDGLITVDSDSGERYEATRLGHAIIASSLSPEDGVFVHEEIRRALRAFVMDGEMHIFYMFTPVQWSGLAATIDWRVFQDQMDRLDESGMRVLESVGVNPTVVNRMASGGRPLAEGTAHERMKARIYHRFYAALQLRDLCDEMPVHEVARKYGAHRGVVQTLAQTCQGFGAGMIAFCQRMGWPMLAVVLEHMSDRLRAGARADLLDLARIPFVKSRTARIFWENGLKSLRAVAEADAIDLVPVLLQVSGVVPSHLAMSCL